MDLIILGVGLTVLIARDVYRAIRRKRKEKKLKKRLREAGIEYQGARMGRPIPAPRTARNHPDRPITPPGRTGIGRTCHPQTTDGRQAAVRVRPGVNEALYTDDWNYRRARTMDGSEWYFHHGSDGSQFCGTNEFSEFERMPTPPPAYTGPHEVTIGNSNHHPTDLPPPFEHAYTTDGSGQSAEAQRKADGIHTLIQYDRLPHDSRA